MGSHLFQGIATGNFKVDVRGLGVTLASAVLIGAGPNLDAKATFMDNLATQVIHELKAAPINIAIGSTLAHYIEQFSAATYMLPEEKFNILIKA